MSLEDWTEVVPKRRQGIIAIRCVTSKKSANLTYIAEETRNHALNYTILNHKTLYKSGISQHLTRFLQQQVHYFSYNKNLV